MGALSMFRKIIKRSTKVNPRHPKDPAIAELLGLGVNTASGKNITATTALNISTVWACVKLISQVVASMPLKLYKQEGDKRLLANTNPLYRLLHDQPNSWQTSFDFWQLMLMMLLLRGQAFAYITRTNGAGITGLTPINPSRIAPFWGGDGESVGYAYQPATGEQQVLLQSEIFHLKHMTLDGLNGIDPISHAREMLGLSVGAEEYGARFFSNGASSSGVLTHPEQLSEEAQERLRNQFSARQAGLINAHKPIVLEEGLVFSQTTIPNDAAQFLETRKFQIEEICRWYGVPPHMVGHTEKSTSWGTGLEQNTIGFLIFNLSPLLICIEQTINRDLISSYNKNMYAKYNVKGLLRGDSQARAEYYTKMFMVGALSQNDIRRSEDDEPIGSDGDKYFVPLNMRDSSKEEEPKQVPVKQQNSLDLQAIYRESMRKELGRIASCEAKQLQRTIKASVGDLNKIEKRMAEFFDTHEFFIRSHVGHLFREHTEDFIKSHLNNRRSQLIDALKNSGLDALAQAWREEHFNEYIDEVCHAS